MTSPAARRAALAALLCLVPAGCGRTEPRPEPRQLPALAAPPSQAPAALSAPSSPSSPSSSSPSSSPSSSTALGPGGPASGSCALRPGGRGPWMPGPDRRRLQAAVAQNEACELCHSREARQWRASLHRRSGTNPAYTRAFAGEPGAFCQGCHVPEGVEGEAPPGAVRALGVGCVSCHVGPGGEVLAAPSRGEVREAPHAVLRSAGFAADGACAGCHEFRFPERRGDEDPAFMQTTIREHERSSGRERSCAGCHMPARDGGASHDFAHVRDPAWLRDNLTVEVEREGDLFQVRLRQPRPGHGFPTGDLFRRLEVGVEARAPDGRVLLRERQHLSRRFQQRVGEPGRFLAGDDRVFDGPRDVVFAVPIGARVAWWVSLQRVATIGDGLDPELAKVESEVRIREGVSR